MLVARGGSEIHQCTLIYVNAGAIVKLEEEGESSDFLRIDSGPEMKSYLISNVSTVGGRKANGEGEEEGARKSECGRNASR